MVLGYESTGLVTYLVAAGPESVDAALDQYLAAGSGGTASASLRRQVGGVSDHPAAVLSLLADPPSGLGALRFDGNDGSGSWHTVGSPSVPAGSLPRGTAVRLEQLRRAVHAFVVSGGLRPGEVPWQPSLPAVASSFDPVRPGSEAAEAPRATGIAQPADGGAPLELEPAAGHLRVARGLLERASRDLEILGGGTLLWRDLAARVTYAASQLGALVPDPPRESATAPAPDATTDDDLHAAIMARTNAVATDVDEARLRLAAALTCPDLPGRAMVASVADVLAQAADVVQKLGGRVSR